MKTLLLIGLIISILVYTFRLFLWIKTIILIINADEKTSTFIREMNLKKSTYIFGGIEHVIILSTLITCLIIIF